MENLQISPSGSPSPQQPPTKTPTINQWCDNKNVRDEFTPYLTNTRIKMLNLQCEMIKDAGKDSGVISQSGGVSNQEEMANYISKTVLQAFFLIGMLSGIPEKILHSLSKILPKTLRGLGTKLWEASPFLNEELSSLFEKLDEPGLGLLGLC